ncbi:MAG: cytidylate kinase-like family protein [Spirochaetales bacterium]|jgi:cytidylate kinase|nr:cytidylate kinase-like family protein [Spirochaetales bacterium]
MAVICISRELAANGEETARELAEVGGYRFIERRDIETELARHNISSTTLLQYDEKKPGFWAALSENRDRYVHYLMESICSEAARGNCIILGRGASAVLQDVPGVIGVRIVAPRQERLQRLKTRANCDARSAEQQLKQSDHNRQGFHKYFFDVDWQDPSQYHLTVNTGKMNARQAARVIEEYRQIMVSPETEAEGKIRLEELRLRNVIIGEIIFTRHIQIQELAVTVKGPEVTLTGCAISKIAAANAEEAARGIAGVGTVVNSIMVIPPAPVVTN